MMDWLFEPQSMLENLDNLIIKIKEVLAHNFSHVVLLGMGGSSLAPYVFNEVFEKNSNYPKFFVLDSIHPHEILTIQAQIDIKNTLFIVSSKSGSSLEPNVLYNYFIEEMQKANVKDIYKHFLAITDPVTSLEQESMEKGFLLSVFGKPNIGGRFSACSVFGLVPLLLMGHDAKTLLQHAVTMVNECAPSVLPKDNPGFLLGTFLGTNAKLGCDKLKIYVSKSLKPFGMWLEQLIAESLGKQGLGIVPVVSDDFIEKPDVMHCFIELHGEKISNAQDTSSSIVLNLQNKQELMAHMFLWQIAVSVAGIILGINPFDQPDVELSKILAKKALSDGQDNLKAHFIEDNLKIYSSNNLNLHDFIKPIKSSDYCAILSFLHEGNKEFLLDLKKSLTNTKAEVLCQTGPRYLHSTGQLFKGGGNNSHFILLTSFYEQDLMLNNKFSFAKAHFSQAMGDFMALSQKGKNIVWIDILSNQGFADLIYRIKNICD